MTFYSVPERLIRFAGVLQKSVSTSNAETAKLIRTQCLLLLLHAERLLFERIVELGFPCFATSALPSCAPTCD